MRTFPRISIAIVTVLPCMALADHVPDSLAQSLDPNYVGCLFAVDDAAPIFRDDLQEACMKRFGDICSGRDGIAPPSQIIDCLHFEARRGIEFLEAAVSDLPLSAESEGFFGAMFQRRREQLSADIEELADQVRPQTLEEAVEQVLAMAGPALMLFWLARETETPLEGHVARVSELH